jgi:hypothetical protein
MVVTVIIVMMTVITVTYDLSSFRRQAATEIKPRVSALSVAAHDTVCKTNGNNFTTKFAFHLSALKMQPTEHLI